MDSGLLAEPVIGPPLRAAPVGSARNENRRSILADAEFTTGRGVAKASDAVAVAFDDRVAPLEPLAGRAPQGAPFPPRRQALGLP